MKNMIKDIIELCGDDLIICQTIRGFDSLIRSLEEGIDLKCSMYSATSVSFTIMRPVGTVVHISAPQRYDFRMHDYGNDYRSLNVEERMSLLSLILAFQM